MLALMPSRDPGAAEDRPLVFAAASLRLALDEAAAAFERSSGVAVRLSYAATSALARQIEAGAPADLFIAADEDWVAYLEGHGALAPGSRRPLFGNRLVLVAPADSPAAVDLSKPGSIAGALGDDRLVTADPVSVPLGRHAKAALTTLGHWDSVAGRLVPARDASAALTLVARGEARLGIVYATDAIAEPRVRVVAEIPPSSHPPIVYMAALTANSDNSGAIAFLDFLQSAEARRMVAARGFTVP